MKYSVKKTVGKGAVPVAVLALVKIVVTAAHAAGVTLDEATVMTVAMLGYGAVIAFVNWLKNHKRTAE